LSSTGGERKNFNLKGGNRKEWKGSEAWARMPLEKKHERKGGTAPSDEQKERCGKRAEKENK